MEEPKMPFSEAAPIKSYVETRKRTSASYVKFTEDYRVTLRMLNTNARTVWKHWIQQANKGVGMSANCPNVRADMSVCPLEASVKHLPKDDQTRRDNVARRRFVINVLDRTPFTICNACNTPTPSKVCINCGNDLKKGHDFKPLNKVKIMEGGVQLFNHSLNPIQEMQSEDYNVDITGYDIVFTTSGVGRDKKIAAIPQKPEPLDESALIDPETGEPQALFNLDDLAEPTPIAEIEMMLKGASMQEINEARGINYEKAPF
jgi:hypothetical protein